jgi:hypothetical protein
MRMPVLLILALVAGLFSWTGHARAQTYDPSYPVCMQLGEWGGWRVDCSFASVAQCAASASGRSGTCVPNPYFGLGRRDRRY